MIAITPELLQKLTALDGLSGHDNPAASEPQREERGLALYQGHTGSLAFRVIGGGVVRGL